MMMHRAAGSICEDYTLSNTQLRDNPLQLCIKEVPTGVYIFPTSEMSLQRWHALSPSIFEKLWW